MPFANMAQMCGARAVLRRNERSINAGMSVDRLRGNFVADDLRVLDMIALVAIACTAMPLLLESVPSLIDTLFGPSARMP